jgi:hypothetical protein
VTVLALLRCGVLLLGVCGMSAAPRGQELPHATESASGRRPIERLRERLRSRPAEERERLERHLDAFQGLPAEKRARLLARARVLRERERSLAAGLVPEPRRRLQDKRDVEPEGAAELSRTLLRERFRALGREVRTRLPAELRRRLERAPPEQRRRFLERLGEEREHLSRRVLARMRERFSLSTREFRRLERMPLAERLRALRELDGREHRSL